MRAYVLTHSWLSPIQKGIQAAHAIAELFTNPDVKDRQETADEWGLMHKTLILLNGGDSATLIDSYCLLSALSTDLKLNDVLVPVAPFYEDEQSLEGVLTAVAVVVPQHITELIDLIRADRDLIKCADVWDHPMVSFIDQYGCDEAEAALALFLARWSLAQ